MEIEGRTCIITGANTGIGRATAIELAGRRARLVLAGRSEERTGPVIDEIKAAGGHARFLHLELASLGAVRKAADEFISWGEPLHVLINNAGVARHRGVSVDGFEYTFGVNYLGHYLLTRLLLPAGLQRVVNVSSEMHRSVTAIDWKALRRRGSFVGLPEYRVSKLCNVLFTRELARRHPELVAVAVHPGLVGTEILRNTPRWVNLFVRNTKTPEEGARTPVHGATADDLVSGGYYAKSRLREPGPGALDDELASELWKRSEEWVASWL